MANSYYLRTYGEFAKKEQAVLEEGMYHSKFSKKWYEAVKRLKESGADLGKIRIVTK